MEPVVLGVRGDKMQIDRIGDDLAKAYKDGYQKGLEELAQYIAHALLLQGKTEQKPVEHELTCEDDGTCIPSTVLGSFREETWEE